MKYLIFFFLFFFQSCIFAQSKYCVSKNSIINFKNNKIPAELIHKAKKIFKISNDAPEKWVVDNQCWRCINGKLYVCFRGANIPCFEKANIKKDPNKEMIKFCKKYRDSTIIPVYITGRGTIYQWKCKQGKPFILKQIFSPDKQGYISQIWKRID